MKKILVIDDDRDIQIILCKALERGGYEVISARDAMQGPMLARQQLPDLIILDVMMPAGGGKAVYARLKQSRHTTHIPILIYSAMPRNQVLTEMSVPDGPLIVTKPATIERILALVGNTLAEK